MDNEKICCICGGTFTGWGNNPWPVDKHPDHKCCDVCNGIYVVPARIDLIRMKHMFKEEN